MKIFLLNLCLLVGISTLTAQEKCRLYGYIIDTGTGKPIEKACILLEPSNLGAETNPEGIYFIPNIPPGEYSFTVMMIGYETIEEENVVLKSGESKELNFYLDPVILSSSDEIVVTATRGKSLTNEIPSSVDIIGQETIELKSPQNMAEVLSNIQGVFIKDYGGLAGNKTISLRGSSTEQVLIMLDGQRLNNAQSGQVDLSTLSLGGIEKIEVVRGGNSALYGADAVGGVVNIITKKNQSQKGFSGSATAMVGSFESKSIKTSLSYQSERYGGSISYRRLQSKGNFKYVVNLSVPEELQVEEEKKNNDITSNDIFTRFNFLLGDSLYEKSVDLSYKYYSAERGSPGTSDVPYFEARLWNNNHEFNTIFSGKIFNLRNDLRVQGYIHNGTSRYKNDEGIVNIDSKYRNGTYGFESQMQTIITANHVITYGFGFRYDWMKSAEFPEDHDRKSYYLFVQDESVFRWSQNATLQSISLVPALRYDYFSDYEGRFSPKIGGVFNFGTNWKTTLKWNTGLSYRAPNFNELYWPSDPWTVGNPDLKAERGFDWDLGIRLRYPIFTGIALDMTYFDVRMKDLILWQSVGQIWMPLNVDKVRNKGLEVNFNVNPMWSVLSLNLNYTLLDARNLTEERNTKNKILVYRPRHTLNLGFTLEWQQFRFGYDFSYVSRRYTTAANTAYLDPYNTSDLVFAFQQPIGSWKLTFTFQIKNVLDEKYEIIQYQPIPGREYRANIGIFFN